MTDITIQDIVDYAKSEACVILAHQQSASVYWPMETLLDFAKKQTAVDYRGIGPQWEKLNLEAVQTLVAQRLDAVASEIAGKAPAEIPGAEVASPPRAGSPCKAFSTALDPPHSCRSGSQYPEGPCEYCGCAGDCCESRLCDPVESIRSVPSKVSSSSFNSVGDSSDFGEGGDLPRVVAP